MAKEPTESEVNPRETREWGAAELLNIAETMEHFGRRYRELAEKLKADQRLRVGNIPTLRTSLKHITRAVNVAYEAFDDNILSSGVLAEPLPSAAESAEQARKDAEAAVNKKTQAKKR